MTYNEEIQRVENEMLAIVEEKNRDKMAALVQKIKSLAGRAVRENEITEANAKKAAEQPHV